MTDCVSALYTNHKGDTGIRRFFPIRIYFGSTAWHREPQWILEVFDLDRLQRREYAMSGFVGEWGPDLVSEEAAIRRARSKLSKGQPQTEEVTKEGQL
jgi:hypothetical protein